jgi:hypothetical protein
VNEVSEPQVEALERLIALVHTMLRQPTVDADDRERVSAEFFSELSLLRQDLKRRHSLEEQQADALMSSALTQARKLLRPDKVGLVERELVGCA